MQALTLKTTDLFGFRQLCQREKANLHVPVSLLNKSLKTGLLSGSAGRLFLASMDKQLHIDKFLANIRLDEGVFCLCLQKRSSRRLDQDEYILLNTTSSEHFFKTSSRYLDQGECIRLGHMSLRSLQDVFKTSSRYLQDLLQKRP